MSDTPDAITLTTGSGSTSHVTSSSPIHDSVSGFYFQCAVVVVGVVGTVANALIVYAMVASKQHQKQVLIFNQHAPDPRAKRPNCHKTLVGCSPTLSVLAVPKLSHNSPFFSVPPYRRPFHVDRHKILRSIDML